MRNAELVVTLAHAVPGQAPQGQHDGVKCVGWP